MAMPPDLTSIWSWLYPILIFPTAIYYVIKIIEYFGHEKAVQDSSRPAQTKTVTLLKVEQREPSRRPPVILLVLTLVPASILLTFGVWAIYTWITGRIEVHMDSWTVLFLVMFIGLPLFIMIDNFFTLPKQYKRGRSHVAKEAMVTVANDIDTVFDACYRVLDSMQATITVLEKPNLLKAKLRNSVMTIKIRRIKGSKVQIYILSDSRWLTVKWDAGDNQRNIDRFLRELGKQ